MSSPEKKKLYIDGNLIEVDSDSLPLPDGTNKGSIPQGTSVAKSYKTDSITDDTVNSLIDSLRANSVIKNEAYRVLYYINIPAGVSVDSDSVSIGEVPEDITIYATSSTANILFTKNGAPPSLTGYEFTGWNTSADGSGNFYPYDYGSYYVTIDNNDVKLYAIWQRVQVTLTYQYGTLGDTSSPLPNAKTVYYDSSFNLDFNSVPTINDGSGRVFVGWYISQNEESSITSPQFLEYNQGCSGIYENTNAWPVFAYKVTYNLGSYSDTSTSSVPYPPFLYGQTNDTVAIDVAPSIYPSSGDNSFCGWNENDGYSGFGNATYNQGNSSLTINASNVDLYPVFAKKYRVLYNGNAQYDSSYFYDSVDVFDGQTYSVSHFDADITCVSDPTKTFAGWYDSYSGAVYTNSSQTMIIAGDVTLIPYFVNAASGATLTFDFTGLDTTYDYYEIKKWDSDQSAWVTYENVYYQNSQLVLDVNYSYEIWPKISSTVSAYGVNGPYTYGNTQYQYDLSLSYQNNRMVNKLFTPAEVTATTWSFSEGDECTIYAIAGNESATLTIDTFNITDTGNEMVMISASDSSVNPEFIAMDNLPAGQSAGYSFIQNKTYALIGWNISSYTPVFTGIYGGTDYTSNPATLTIDNNHRILDPKGSTSWSGFLNNESGTISFSSSQPVQQTFNLALDLTGVSGSEKLSLVYMDSNTGTRTDTGDEVSCGNSTTWSLNVGTEYWIQIENGNGSGWYVEYTGTYPNVNPPISLQEDNDSWSNLVIYSPSDTETWTGFTSNDSGTITITTST